jgi:hypothetical protein
MTYARFLRLLPVLVCATDVALSAAGQGGARDAESMRQKMATIAAQGEQPSRQLRRTMVTERELNAILLDTSAVQLPAGIVEPTIAIVGTQRISARAVVDLDGVRRQMNPTSLLDPTSFLRGRLPVAATGTFRTANGIGRLDLESVAVGSVPVSKGLLQEIVGYYTRTTDNPRGIGLDDPFPLPANIREIQIDRGQAVIVQ